MPYINDDQTAEFVYIVQALCDAYGFKQEDLAQFGHIITIWRDQHRDKVRFTKQIPFYMLVPPEMSKPVRSHGKIPPRVPVRRSNFTRVRIDSDPNPSMPDAREYGLHEYSLKTKSGTIRFWRCMTYRDYGPIGQILHFVEKKNLKKFYRAILQFDRDIVIVPPPVMEKGKLRDIYNNSIGFLEEGEKNQELHEKYDIPCKRGILLAGKPGCVLGDTIIRVRKKSKKGTHKVYDV